MWAEKNNRAIKSFTAPPNGFKGHFRLLQKGELFLLRIQ